MGDCSSKPPKQRSIDDYALTDISLAGSSITRSLVRPNEVNVDVEWRLARFHVDDSITNGPQRTAIIEYTQVDQDILLKTVSPLTKREFEEIFFFSCGEFVEGRIIRTHESFLRIH